MSAAITRDVVIIGSGPAGLTAAVYAARAALKPLVIEGADAGGQLTLTTEVENFPGHPSIMGPDLIASIRAQAESFGAEFLTEHVRSTSLTGTASGGAAPFELRTDSQTIHARTVIVSTGASARMLGLPSERALLGHGVSTCATCDGFFFKGKRIAVIGGGDSALEEATFLTRFASHVTLVHRRDTLRASKIMQDKAKRNPKITFAYNSEVVEILSENGKTVSSLRLRDVRTQEESSIPLEGVFVAIGHTPNTAVFAGQLETDAGGYIVTHEGTKTSVPGVFACGDVQDSKYRQAITAAGSGCAAALDAERYIESLGAHE